MGTDARVAGVWQALQAVVAGRSFAADELPEPEAWEREPPKVQRPVGRGGMYA